MKVSLNTEAKKLQNISTQRLWRDSELAGYVDSYQKVLVWNGLTDDQKIAITNYRNELLAYPQQIDFPNGTRPIRPNIQGED